MKSRLSILAVFLTAVFVSFVILNHRTVAPAKYDLSTSKGLNAYLFAQKVEKKKHQKFDRPDDAMEEEIALRSEINQPFSYSGNWRFQAWEQAQTMRNPSRDVLPWEEHGPANIGGRTRALIIDPRDSTVWYAGSVGGGVWMTTNMGLNWTCLTDSMPVISVTTLAQSSSEPDIIYAGTGEGFYNSDAVIGDGILKTSDGGAHWTQLSSTVNNSSFRYVNRIVVNPRDPQNVLAATNTGLYRSMDGGATWTETFNNSNRIQQVVANPHNFDVLYLTSNEVGIFKSTDNGQTWNQVDTFTGNFYRIEMAVAPSDPDVLYAATVNGSSGLGSFYRSADAGVSWFSIPSSVNWLGGQGWYDNTLVVDPFDANRVYVGGINLYQCNVNGSNMSVSQISMWYSQPNYPYVHADQHFLVTLPLAGGTFGIVATNDGGVFYSPDEGATWNTRISNYNVTQFYDGDMHPGMVRIIAGAQDNGTDLSPAGADSASSWTQPVGGDGFDCAWNKSDAQVLYATLYSTRIYKSTNDGNSFYEANNGLPSSSIFHTPLAMSPFDPDVLFTAGDGDAVYRTDDGAENWQFVSANFSSYPRKKIAPSLSTPDVVWAGSISDYINVSTDGGQSFSLVNRPAGSPNGTMTGISTHPSLDSTAFVTYGVSGYGKIFRTDDLGQTWTDITHNLPDIPVHCVLVMPNDTSMIWIGTDVGIFESTDDGQTWMYSNSGLPAVSVRRLKIIGQRVLAVTHGRGTFSVFMEELPPIELPLLPPILADLSYPLPGNDDLAISFSTRSAHDSVRITLDDSVNVMLGSIDAYVDTGYTFNDVGLGTHTISVVGLNDGVAYASETQTITLYNPEISVTDNFDSTASFFSGDFTVSQEPGFLSKTLNSPHPYGSGQDYYAILGVPIVVQPNQELTYRDIAIVEPGESGSEYPDSDFWDYVTVEGSTDGMNWTILVDPYDCRFNPTWLQAYNSGGSGNETMFQDHTVLLTDTYSENTLIYIRFHLFADEYVTGWGWGIDDVRIGTDLSVLPNPSLPQSLTIYPAYPNPFNSTTVIPIRLAQSGNLNVTIYNILGQKVRALETNRAVRSGETVFLKWNGQNDRGAEAASGTYMIRTVSGNQQKTLKVLYIK